MQIYTVIAPTPTDRFSDFEKKAYFHRPTRAANENNFDEVLQRVLRVNESRF